MSVALQDFGWALAQMRFGLKVTRPGWSGKGMWIQMIVPDKASKITVPYILLYTAQGMYAPWLACQLDLLALDWAIQA